MELKVTVPNRMEEITLEQYQRFLKECSDKETQEDIIALKMLEIFCGVPPAETYTYRMSDVYSICDQINKALNEKPPLISRWKFKDIELGFIPKLDDMTFGEYVDLDTYIVDWEQMHKAMAVLYRPVKQQFKGSYEIEKYNGDSYWELMKKMPLSLVMGCMLFFWNLENDLVEVMKNSSNPVQKQIYQERLTSMLNTDGITLSGDLQTKTLPN
jgi:ribosome-binding factor A|tara:strand:+ start:4795 stop:5433 length:639 start_codon:yes stop_codon:yes gene_type:complete